MKCKELPRPVLKQCTDCFYKALGGDFIDCWGERTVKECFSVFSGAGFDDKLEGNIAIFLRDYV